MPGFRFVVADVFTDVPFAGNQLAVFTDARDIPEERLQLLARELNYSETTFVYGFGGWSHRTGSHGGNYRRGIDANNWPQIYPIGFLPLIGTPDVIWTIPWLLLTGVAVSVLAGFLAMLRFLEV